MRFCFLVPASCLMNDWCRLQIVATFKQIILREVDSQYFATSREQIPLSFAVGPRLVRNTATLDEKKKKKLGETECHLQNSFSFLKLRIKNIKPYFLPQFISCVKL